MDTAYQDSYTASMDQKFSTVKLYLHTDDFDLTCAVLASCIVFSPFVLCFP